MHKLVALFLLTLVPLALACPLKKGFMAGGLLPLPAGYQGRCDDAWKSSRSGFQNALGDGQQLYYYEQFIVPAKGFGLDDLAEKLSSKGFKTLGRMRVGQVDTLRMRNSQGQVLDVTATRLSATHLQLALGLVKY